MYISKLNEKHSMYHGLDDLQSQYLRDELKKNHRRSIHALRRIAKRKAVIQRLKWFLGETLVLFGIAGFIAVCVLTFLVWTY